MKYNIMNLNKSLYSSFIMFCVLKHTNTSPVTLSSSRIENSTEKTDNLTQDVASSTKNQSVTFHPKLAVGKNANVRTPSKLSLI